MKCVRKFDSKILRQTLESFYESPCNITLIPGNSTTSNVTLQLSLVTAQQVTLLHTFHSNTSDTFCRRFSAHWLLTLADRLSPLSLVANPSKAPTRLYTRYEKIQLETVTHPGTNPPNVA